MDNPILLDTSSFRQILVEKLIDCQNEIIICSPFIKLKALEWISKKIKKDINVKIISRLSVKDIFEGASDFEICQFTIDKGWKIGLLKNLHAKIYITDKKNILIGSNNLTLSGLGIEKEGNAELGIAFEPDIKSFDTIKNLLLRASWLDQKKINLMNDHLLDNNTFDTEIVSINQWPKEIFNKENEHFFLFSSNFPDLTPKEFLNGQKTLFLDPMTENNKVENAFISSDVYLWLLKMLQNNKKGKSSFGWLTSEIHSAILDDPLPYRSNIKEMCNCLFQWVDEFSNDIKIVNHTHTKSMKLLI